MLRHIVCTLLLALASLSLAQLPPGFADEPYTTGLSQPVAIAFDPGNRMFIAQKGGTVRVVDSNGNLLAGIALTLSVTSNSERGLLGIAFDPDFQTNNYVYLYYTTGASSLNAPATPKNRVSRFLVDGNTILLNSETILVDNIPSDAGNHNAGCLRFGQDGRLYIATGDGGSTSANSQNLSNLAGKILRINKDGSIPNTNPFFGQAGAREEIYVYGLRNPFRFSFRPGTNTLYIGDVGQSTWEEVNVGVPGGNYGWPTYEGPTDVPGFISPAFSYAHATGVRGSITGGVFMNLGSFPAPYEGSYFYADYVRDVIRRLTFNGSNVNTGSFDWSPMDGVVDFAPGPNGALYYVSLNTASVRRIIYRANLTTLSLDPDEITAGWFSTGTVTLDHPAPVAGAVVGLDTTVGASVPSTVTVPSGQTSATFKINTSTGSAKDITVTAFRNGVVRNAVLHLTATPNAAFVGQSVPTTMVAGQSYAVAITMQNTGPTTWTHDSGYRLASYNPANNLTWGTSRIFLPSGASVAPGAQHTFTATIKAPSTPGDYVFEWKMLLDGYRTFGETSDTLNITVTGGSNDSEFMSQSVPTTVQAGALFNATLSFRNNGGTSWSDATGYRLASRNPPDNRTWGYSRVFLPTATVVEPGESVAFTRTFRAPSTPGIYAFQWKMLLDGVGTFGDSSPTILIQVTAGGDGAEFVSQTVPASVQPGASFDATIVIRNIGGTTWTHEGGYRLASRNPADNTTWGTNRVFIPNGVSVSPGNSHSFTRTFKAPTTPGTYVFSWKMLLNGTGTFGEETFFEITVEP